MTNALNRRALLVDRAGRLHEREWRWISAACAIWLSAFILPYVGGKVFGEDWAQWRGPMRNAVSSETGLPLQWSNQEAVRWKVSLPGAGVSSPITWEDRIYVTATEGRLQDELVLMCLQRADGKERWRLRLWGTAPTLHHASKSDMATPTPVTDGEFIYAFYGTGDLFCVDRDGSLVWQRSLASEYGVFENRFGHTSSPALHGDFLLLQCDHYGASYLLAVDKRTGENRWKSDRPGVWHSWSSPQVVGEGETASVIVCAAERMDAYEVRSGKLQWTVRGLQRECIPTPVLGHGLIYTVSGPKGAVMAVRPDGSGDVSDSHVVWQNRRGSSYVPSAVLVGKHYYLVDDAGVATCLDAETGRQHWRQRLGGAFTASPIAGDGKVYFTNDDGETFVIRAGHNSFEQLARNAIGEPVYASPIMSAGCMFIRTPQHLFCITELLPAQNQ